MSGSIFVHDFSSQAPDCPLECGAPSSFFDETVMRRIEAALKRSISASTTSEEDIWTPIVTRHQIFVDTLTTGNLRAANEILARMFASPMTYGFEQFDGMYEALLAQPTKQQQVRELAFDRLLSLAAFLRAIPVQTVEQGDFRPYLREHPDALLDRIEEKIQREIRAPRFHGGLFGLKTKRGLFTERSITAIYVALRLRALLSGITRPRICEIGGGAGYLAYFCNWLGLADYTIVDLPTVSAVQAYFLAQNLGADRISLSGESGDRYHVKLLGGIEASSFEFDIIVNVDSLPEMSGPIMRDYLGRGGFRILLSINQEAMAPRSAQSHQERVGDVIDEIGGFHLLSRYPFWMRPGYVEEVYETLGRDTFK
jgi:hypothetical protein